MEHETAPAGELLDNADAAHGTSTEVAHEEGPIPLLQPAYFDNLIFWAVVSLVAIYLILTRMALPRIGATLATRQGTIGGDLAAAERLRHEAREAQAAYDKAVAEARAEANRIANAARAEIQADLDAALRQADARIEARSAEGARAVAEIQAQAQASVALVARDVAREIVGVMGGTMDDTAVDRAVQARVGG